jgi:hypothetical protein
MITRSTLCSALLLFSTVILGGCTNYVYDVTPSGAPPLRVPGDRFVTVPQGPLDYRLRTSDNHLVVQVWNPTTEPVRIIGEKSVVVDPRGRSHAVRPQTIAPGSYVRFILPPVLRTVSAGPSYSVGFGVGGGYWGGRRGHWRGGYYSGFYDPFWFDQPRYYAVVDGEQSYWEWDGPGEARLILVIEHLGQQLTQEMRIQRFKD